MKLSQIKNKGFLIVFFIFFLSFVADLASTLSVGELVKYLEANPFYNFGGLAIPILLNIGLLIFIYYHYTHTNNIWSRYMLMVAMVSSLFIRIPVIISNFQIAAVPVTPEVIEAAKQVTQQVKDAHYMQLVVNYLLFLINPLITFFFFKMDHKIEVKNETIQNRTHD